MGDFVAPGRNAPLVRASFELHTMVALRKEPLAEAWDVGMWFAQHRR